MYILRRRYWGDGLTLSQEIEMTLALHFPACKVPRKDARASKAQTS